MKEMFVTEAFDLAVLSEIKAASTEHAGFLLGAKVGLFENAIQANRSRALGEYTAPGYTGYAAVVLTFTAPTIGDDGKPELVTNTAVFRPSDALGSTTVARGVIVTNGAADALYAAGNFDVDEPLGKATDELRIAIIVKANGKMYFHKVA